MFLWNIFRITTDTQRFCCLWNYINTMTQPNEMFGKIGHKDLNKNVDLLSDSIFWCTKKVYILMQRFVYSIQ